MYDAARRAAIHETISNFPDKYSTIVGERGLKVSILMLYLECFQVDQYLPCERSLHDGHYQSKTS